MGRFWRDTRFAAIVWPAFTVAAIYQGSILMAVFGAFWTGVSLSLLALRDNRP
jgi:hypothetical protein